MRKLIVVLAFIALIGSLSAAYWVTDFNTCPQTYQSQTCISPTLVCGYNGGITYCADPSTITAPGSPATSNTDQDSGSYNGGYLIDCYAFDSGSPYCNNNGAFWCDRNSTCHTTNHRDTTCTASLFGASTCGSCRSGYDNCTGDDDCETQLGVSSCAVGSNNNVPSCGGCVCDTGAYDCDSSGAGVGNGCEIANGAACTIGGLTGVYSGCSGAVGNCVVPTSNFVTGVQANYSTTNFLLWGKNFGLGWLMNLTNSTNSSIGIDQNACIFFPDATTQCTASSGGYSYSQISANIGNWSDDKLSYATQAYANAINNLSYSQISANIGNWTLDKPSYASTAYVGAMNNLSLSQIASNIGNWTLDKINYVSTAYVNAMNNLSYSQISANIGNWTLDKPSYASTTYVGAMNNLSYSQISTNIGNYSKDQAVLYLNVTGLNTTKVPYTGATEAVNLGTYNITAQNYSVTGSPGYIGGNATCFKMYYNSSMWFGVGSAC